ncbi:hypothetical protein MTR_7g053390 [Medicago truncatula]|nr:hypothetical protein MTR_7g053390 [Medicago truncatula]
MRVMLKKEEKDEEKEENNYYVFMRKRLIWVSNLIIRTRKGEKKNRKKIRYDGSLEYTMDQESNGYNHIKNTRHQKTDGDN